MNNATTINEAGVFEMYGNFVVGRNNKRKNLALEGNATLKIEGNLIIYGDLILNDGATLEIIGEGSIANIFGTVKKSNTAEVKGKFNDIRNIF